MLPVALEMIQGVSLFPSISSSSVNRPEIYFYGSPSAPSRLCAFIITGLLIDETGKKGFEFPAFILGGVLGASGWKGGLCYERQSSSLHFALLGSRFPH